MMEQEETSLRAALRRMLCAAMALTLCLLVLAAFCRGENGYLPAGADLLWAGATLLALLAAHWCARRAAPFVEQYFPWLLAGLCAAFFTVQLVLGARLRFEPEWDMLAVYQGGISWGT